MRIFIFVYFVRDMFKYKYVLFNKKRYPHLIFYFKFGLKANKSLYLFLG